MRLSGGQHTIWGALRQGSNVHVGGCVQDGIQHSQVGIASNHEVVFREGERSQVEACARTMQ